jgi:hypothetical protein
VKRGRLVTLEEERKGSIFPRGQHNHHLQREPCLAAAVRRERQVTLVARTMSGGRYEERKESKGKKRNVFLRGQRDHHEYLQHEPCQAAAVRRGREILVILVAQTVYGGRYEERKEYKCIFIIYF